MSKTFKVGAERSRIDEMKCRQKAQWLLLQLTEDKVHHLMGYKCYRTVTQMSTSYALLLFFLK